MTICVNFKSSRLWVFWSKVYHRKTTFFERQKNWKSAGGGRNRPERFLMGFGHHYRNIWHLSIKKFWSVHRFWKKYWQVTVGPLFPDSTVGIQNARKYWKFHFILQNLKKSYILSLYEHLRQLVGLGGDSRCSFTFGALILMIWMFPEDHRIILGDISKPQACTMSPSDYTYPQTRKMSKFLKENDLKNSIFEKIRFLLFNAYGPQKWSYGSFFF